ncbi:molybdopterin-dependent oxidoreductase [Poseidonocella sp. HB161398]|uniref:molybdopterin-dependent oxidoreductase n=1 Tax=Poseidonocella sp. HB161398 TaxID=2320855 RepID=UPI00110993BB|nr:molybdopterin-dependent oxidoreductase [Poseidonocella sp. HB161398]
MGRPAEAPAGMPEQDPLVAMHWGAYRAEREGGRLVSLRGMEDDPEPSPIGQSIAGTLSGPCRIRGPMIRRGFLEQGHRSDTARRGADSFVETGWDEALDLAAAELERVRSEHGNAAIYSGSYGWASAGRFHHAKSQLRRFMNMFGGSTVSVNTYSCSSAEVILPHVVGPFMPLLAEHTSWEAVAEAGSLVVAFGGLARRNGQVNAGGVGRHVQHAAMMRARRAGARFVNVSPIRSDADPELGADWLPVRPGTDVALMLGLAHELLREGHHDRAFLESHCTGFAEFLPYLEGAADGQPKDAAWAAEITGLPAAAIADLARRLAQGPAILNASWSLTRQQNGEQIYWMLVVLAAMLGGIGRPGEGFALGLGAVNGVGNAFSPLPLAALPMGGDPCGSFIPVARISDMLLSPGAAYRYDGQTRHYPEVRLIYWAGGNVFHHHQDLNRLRRAWQRAGTVIVHEPFWTPMARHADIVLPSTLPAERSDIVGTFNESRVMFSSQVAAPHGQTRNDHDIFAGLAARLRPGDGNGTGFAERFTEGLDEAGWLRRLYEASREAVPGGADWPDFAAFCAKGHLDLPPPERPQTMLAAFRADPAGAPLPTPSGRIEIFSAAVAAFGAGDLPGHPVWRAPREWLGSALSAALPLHLISHQPEGRLHSQLDHGATSLAGKRRGREPCRLNPGDAAERGISEGDMVRVFNHRGACLSVARLSRDIRRGVISLPTGAWHDPDLDGDPALCRHGNPNVLTSDLPTSEIAQGPAAMTCLVEAELFTGPVPEVMAHRPPEIERRKAAPGPV